MIVARARAEPEVKAHGGPALTPLWLCPSLSPGYTQSDSGQRSRDKPGTSSLRCRGRGGKGRAGGHCSCHSSSQEMQRRPEVTWQSQSAQWRRAHGVYTCAGPHVAAHLCSPQGVHTSREVGQESSPASPCKAGGECQAQEPWAHWDPSETAPHRTEGPEGHRPEDAQTDAVSPSLPPLKRTSSVSSSRP